MTTFDDPTALGSATQGSAAHDYDTAGAPLTAVVDSVADWSAPSPCDGWTALDVLDHLISTQRGLLAERGIDLDALPELALDPAGGWSAHYAQVRRRLADPAVSGLAYEGFFGPTTLGETMTRFYVFDMLVHRWDLARAAGGTTRFTDAELDRIEAAAESFGPMLYADGICRPGVTAPDGADRQARALAVLGRQE